MHFIYRITNSVNGKVYIGQTNNPDLRWSQHKSNAKYKRNNQVITHALIKYGVDAFLFEVISTCRSQEDVDFTEQQVIHQYDSRSSTKGYNVDIGGNTSPRTPEIVQRITDGLKKHYETHDGWNKGRTLTEDWKNKISQSHVGLPGTNTGRKFDEEWKAKIAASNKGKLITEKHRQNLSKSHLGQMAPNRKLDFDVAQQIRQEYGTGLVTQKQLAIKYGVSQDSIFKIIKNRTYIK